MKRLTGMILSLVLLLATLGLAPVHAQNVDLDGHGGNAIGKADIGLNLPTTFLGHEEIWYNVSCFDSHHHLVWTRHTKNMLTTQGATLYIIDTLTTGVSSPTWYVGLIYGSSAPTFATTDTLSSNGWTPAAEVTGTQVTNSTRPAFTASTASAGSTNNSASPAVYTGNASVTLQGLFMSNSATLDSTSNTSTSNVLLGEATFTAAPIASGYTINVTATVSITAG